MVAITYFVGSNTDALQPSVSGVQDAGGVLQFSRNEACYADAYITDPVDGVRRPVTSLWFHGDIRNPGMQQLDIVSFYNSQGVVGVKLVGNSAGQAQMQLWTGSSYANVGVPAVIGSGNLDIRLEHFPLG